MRHHQVKMIPIVFISRFMLLVGLIGVSELKPQDPVLSNAPSEVEEGAELRVSCSAKSLKPPKSLTWYPPHQGHSSMQVTRMGSSLVYLIIPKFTYKDTGRYVCKMVTSDGQEQTAEFQVAIRQTDNEPSGCDSKQFSCKGSGYCIPARFRCDGKHDCLDGSDEDCTLGFTEKHQQALTLSKTTSRTLEGSKLQVNCTVNVDTPFKSLRWTGHTSMTQVRKGLKTVLMIIPKIRSGDAGLYICEMILEDSRVEKAEFRLFVKPRVRDPDTCSVTQFKCTKTRHCIFMRFRCDGKDDCGDGSDEECEGDPCDGRFRCNNSRCIDWSSHCNHNNDCGDHSDEGDFCYRKPSTTVEPAAENNHFSWLKTTVYTVIACTIALVITISFIIIIVFRIKMKRRRSQRMACIMENMQGADGSGDASSPGPSSQHSFLPNMQQGQYGNIIVNVNNGVQYMPGLDYPVFMDSPPPYSELNNAEDSSSNSPPPYSTLDRERAGLRDAAQGSQARPREMTQSAVQNCLGAGRAQTGQSGRVGGNNTATESDQRGESSPDTLPPSHNNTLQGITIDSQFLQSLLASHGPGSTNTTDSFQGRVLDIADPSSQNPSHISAISSAQRSNTSNQPVLHSIDSSSHNTSDLSPHQSSHNDSRTLVQSRSGDVQPHSGDNVASPGETEPLLSSAAHTDSDRTSSQDDLPGSTSEPVTSSSISQSVISPSGPSVIPHTSDNQDGDEDSLQPLLAVSSPDRREEGEEDLGYDAATLCTRQFQQNREENESVEENHPDILMPSSSHGLDEDPNNASTALLQEVSRRDQRSKPKPGHLSVHGGQIVLHTQDGVLASQEPEGNSDNQLVSENRPESNIPWLNGELCVQDGNLLLRVPNKPVPLEMITTSRGAPRSRDHSGERGSASSSADSAPAAGNSHSLDRPCAKTSDSPVVPGLTSQSPAAPSPASTDPHSGGGRRSGELNIKDGQLVLEAPKHTPSSQILSHLQGAYAAEEEEEEQGGLAGPDTSLESLEPVVNTKRHGSSAASRAHSTKHNTDIVLPFKH